MNFPLHQVIDQALIQRIGLTLLHSLWQGLLMALLAGCILLLTRKSNPNVRYRFFVGLLSLFAIGIGLTFYRLAEPDLNPSTREMQEQTNIGSVWLPAGPKPNYASSLLIDGVTFFTTHLTPIVLIWMLILVVKSIQFTRNLYELRGLRRTQTFKAGTDWENRVKGLASQLGIPRTVELLQSGFIKSPMVMGHFKPVILVPLGILTAIPPNEIELMLLHELAHIKRHDFLVNLMQHLLEILFFFNPGLLWLSARIRAESEACCDELVLSQANSKRNYIRALLSFREYQLEGSEYGLAFARRNGLLHRVERLVLQTNTTLNLPEKVILSVSAVLICTVGLLYAAPFTGKAKPPYLNQSQTGFSVKKELTANPSAFVAKNGQTPESKTKPQQEIRRSEIGKKHEFSSESSPVLRESNRNQLQTLPSLQGQLVQLQPEAFTDSLPETPRLQLNPVSYSPAPLNLRKPVFQKPVTEQLIDEIVQAGLSPSRDNLFFHITNEFLIVNGTRQSDEVHRQIIEKFVKKPGDLVDFTYRNTR